MALEDYLADFAGRDWETERVDGAVRFALVGIGRFARERALPAIEACERCRATVLVTGSPDRSAAVAETFDVDHVIEYEGFLDGALADQYDAVYVGGPNAFHPEYAIAAAEHGAHVLCEKPLAVDAESARSVVEACEAADVTLMTAYRLQLEPAVRRTRDLVRGGVIGEPVQLHGGFSNPLLQWTDADSWRLDPELAGGGALIDLGIYPLNTTRFLLESDPTAVAATTHTVDEPFTGVDEHVAFQLEFPGPVTASMTASVNAHGVSGLQLVGTEGTIRIASPFGGVVTQDLSIECGDVAFEYTGEPVDEVVEEFAYFSYCVLTGTRPEPDGRDGLADLRAIEATYQAAETGRWVDIEV